MGEWETGTLYVRRHELRKAISEKSRKWGEKPEKGDDKGGESSYEDDYEDEESESSNDELPQAIIVIEGFLH